MAFGWECESQQLSATIFCHSYGVRVSAHFCWKGWEVQVISNHWLSTRGLCILSVNRFPAHFNRGILIVTGGLVISGAFREMPMNGTWRLRKQIEIVFRLIKIFKICFSDWLKCFRYVFQIERIVITCSPARVHRFLLSHHVFTDFAGWRWQSL